MTTFGISQVDRERPTLGGKQLFRLQRGHDGNAPSIQSSADVAEPPQADARRCAVKEQRPDGKPFSNDVR